MLWNKRRCKCQERPKCKTKCAPGKELHPFKSCKCVSSAGVQRLKEKVDAKVVRCEVRTSGKTSLKPFRCGGALKKCNIYERWDWDDCKCKRKDYCPQGCPAGQVLHPGYSCKCIDFLDEGIEESCMKEETAEGCGDEHYFDDNAQMCVKYNCCQKFNDCGTGFRWSQSACDCVQGQSPTQPTKPVE